MSVCKADIHSHLHLSRIARGRIEWCTWVYHVVHFCLGQGLIDTRDRGYGYEMMDKLRYTVRSFVLRL